jgi:sugar transferase (PEP-CTERM/EpsH1 system associated)
MNILFFTARIPFPPDRGDRIRPYYMIKYLSQNHSVSLLTFTDARDELWRLEGLKGYCKHMEVVVMSKLRSYSNILLHPFSKKPFQCLYYDSREMREKINKLLRDYKFGIVHIFPLRLAGYLKYFGNSRVVIDFCDSKALLHSRLMRLRTNPIFKLIDFEEWLKMEFYEAKINRTATKCIAISSVDKEVIERKGNSNHLEVIPNGVDLSYFKPWPAQQERNSLIFVGSMDVIWNVDAVLYFYNKILPHVRKKIPDVKLYVVGANPAWKIRSLSRDPNVVITSNVLDVRPFIARSILSIVPMRLGAGIKNKVLESMAMRRPVISTTIGAEGIDVAENENILIADDPHDFAEKTIEVLENHYLRNRLAENGYRLVREKYDWFSVVGCLEKIYQSMLNN